MIIDKYVLCRYSKAMAQWFKSSLAHHIEICYSFQMIDSEGAGLGSEFYEVQADDDVVNFHFYGAQAEEMRLILALENFATTAELVELSAENYSFYKMLLAHNRPVIVRPPDREEWATIVEAFDFFPELRFEEPRADAEQAEPLHFSVVFQADTKQRFVDEAAMYGLDFDTYLANALAFERMVARLNGADFSVMALDSPGARTGNNLTFA